MEQVTRAYHVQKLRALLQRTTEFINQQSFIPRQNTAVDAVALAFVSKAISVGLAICSLVHRGFDDEALGLSRTLVEMSMTLRFIANKDSFERARRYAGFLQKFREGWLTKVIPKHFPGSEPNLGTRQRKEMLEMAKEFTNAILWSGKTTKDMAMEPDELEKDSEGQPYKDEFDYEVMFNLTSQPVHATSAGIEPHVNNPGEVFRVGVKHSGLFGSGDLALHNAATYLNKIILNAFRIVGCTLSSGLSAEFDYAARLSSDVG